MQNVEVIKAKPQETRGRIRNKENGGLRVERLRVAAYCRVSTDGEEQLSSYQSQLTYYKEMIEEKENWVLVKIYADEAITGTSTKKREGFQEMINDCMNGDIDMIVTKSISRFARNTLDTLQYVRMLKEKNIAIFFEKENLNTLKLESEFMLSVFSSMAQQDVETLSANVKMGLKMKMRRGELIGFQGCLGYDYHPEDKSITVNEEEAEIVRYIFDMYLQGYGTYIIAKELTRLGKKTKKGSGKWGESGVRGIIKNEKYKGDILLGKTFTVDPISKRRLDNFGESDQFYLKKHHEPIVSEEVWEKAKEIRLNRNVKGKRMKDGKREKYTRKFAFSSMLECGFCGTKLTRRTVHSGSKYEKWVWHCRTATNKGKDLCPHCKAIEEKIVEDAFLEAYKLLVINFDDVIESVLGRMQDVLSDDHDIKKKQKIDKDITALESKKNKLTDLLLEGAINKEAYSEKYGEVQRNIQKLVDTKEALEDNIKEQKNISKRMEQLRKALINSEILDEFDRIVFESIVDKAIVGTIDENDNIDPYKLIFVLKGVGTHAVTTKKSKTNEKGC